jgi:hypothetical protein
MTAESLGWLAPAPVWGDGGIGVESNQLLQPFLTELTSDQFVTEFLGVLAGASPADLATMAPDKGDGTNAVPYRLYQPLSQRYYLVTASLVCRRVGIPDRGVQRSKGERTTFVLRKVADGSELAWVPAPAAVPGDPPGGSWQPTVPGQLTPGEEQLPMHPAPVAGFAQPGTTAAAFGMSESGRRTVHYGYIPTSRRERLVTALTSDQAVAALQKVDPQGKENPTLSALWTRVILPLGVLRGELPPSPPPPAGPPQGTNTNYSSLYILLDLSDWLNTYLPSVHDALIGNTILPSNTPAEELRAALADVSIHTIGPGSAVADVPLHQVLSDLAPFHTLVMGADIERPTTSYDLVRSAIPDAWFADPDIGPTTPSVPASLAYMARAALNEYQVQPIVPDELKGMIKADPALPPPGYSPDTYIIRTVFEHDPCLPVLSAPSGTFQLARALDGDAPARKIRIALPDISNLRQFKRGVAIEMPPSLRRVLDRVTPAMLQGQGLGSDPGVELGMICSFSIQIMWVLSFMVMFLFVIAFNIIFWWMAFIKICFPIPVPASQPKNPSP